MRFCVSGDFDKNEFLESLSLKGLNGNRNWRIFYGRWGNDSLLSRRMDGGDLLMEWAIVVVIISDG